MKKIYCGNSDIGGVILVTPNKKEGMEDYIITKFIPTGCDGQQTVNLLSTGEKAPAGYEKVVNGCIWYKIYDDDRLIEKGQAKEVNLYYNKNERIQYILELIK